MTDTLPRAGRQVQPTLKTDRLTLRPLRLADAAFIALYAGDAQVARMTTSIPHPYPPGAAESYVRGVMAGRAQGAIWAMQHDASRDEQLIGTISLRPDGVVGYWVGAPFWNAGFATEALAEVSAHALATSDQPITATVFQDNPVSAKVLTKVGFRYCGEDTAFCVARNATVPRWCYVLERSGWSGT